MAQKLNFGKPKLTLTEFGIKLLLSQNIKNNPQMLCMLLRILRVDQNIINEDYYEFMKIRLKNSIHIIHEYCWSIGQTKRHNQKFIMTITSPESSFGHVRSPDTNLMIPGSKINLGKDSSSS